MKLPVLHRVTALLLLFVLPAAELKAAEPLHVVLTINGTPLEGDGPDKEVIAFGFDNEVVVDRDASSGQTTGRRIYKPLRIVKAIDKTTPLLFKALAQNQVIAGEFRLRRPNPTGDGIENYYTVSITGGRVAGIRDWKTNTRDLSADRAGDLEEVSFVFQTITFTYNNGGITFTDTWSGNQ